jgi:hypothetical protein
VTCRFEGLAKIMSPEALTVDYWEFYTKLIKDVGISPSEAWGLDMLECFKLLDLKLETKQDLSLMLNYKRLQFGASYDWLMR